MGMQTGLMGVVLAALAVISCGAADSDETDDSASPEATGFFQEALIPGCPSAGTNVCTSSAGPAGACCRCNSKYGTWTKLLWAGYVCTCQNVCTKVSTQNLAGMCCTCNGVPGTFVQSATPSIYNCRP